ncbi:MAG: pyruvate kinase [Atopococcus tabaci]|uniref:Pyruvate kinase n=1 Tax=Atopococcus tabaci TaxID=269774 RepID=A0AA43RJX5_9LACT|nr:pyruvate kinase [Atopococcus tabaci]
MRKTKIVCTIGPVSDDIETLCQLIDAGMNVARLNFSHGDHESHLKTIQNIRKAEEIKGQWVGIMLDTKGPEIRTHQMQDGEFTVKTGDKIAISMEEVVGGKGVISVTYPNLIHELQEGTRILIDDGLIELEVQDLDEEKGLIHTISLSQGIIYDKKGVNIPQMNIELPHLTEKDYEDIHFGLFNGINFIAPSFVRNAEGVLEIREILKHTNHEHVAIIPKIENQEGVNNIEEILSVSDGLMVARGDLGVEIPPERVPIIQKELILKSNQSGKPVITATQMLDSMQWNPRPTRAEANDVANAIYDGTDAVMLSGETASGKYPVEAVETMHRIARSTEDAITYSTNHSFNRQDMTEAIGQAVAHTAKNLDITTIVANTESGYTARMISKYRPKAQIVAITFSKESARNLSLLWGTQAIVADLPESTDDMFQAAERLVQEYGYADPGDMFITTAGVPIGVSGTTNLMRIQTINEQLLQGQGIGNQTITGIARIVSSAEEAQEKAMEGCILVLKSTNREYLPAMQKCSGIIAERGGLTGHTAIMALELGKPLIIGATDATKVLEDNQLITLDSRRGIVYAGKAKTI